MDFSDPAWQETQLKRVVDAIQGKGALPELRPEDAFPSPKQRRWELRWFAVAGVAAVLTLFGPGRLYLVANRCRSTMPEKQFNIAVADFLVVNANGRTVRARRTRVL